MDKVKVRTEIRVEHHLSGMVLHFSKLLLLRLIILDSLAQPGVRFCYRQSTSSQFVKTGLE